MISRLKRPGYLIFLLAIVLINTAIDKYNFIFISKGILTVLYVFYYGLVFIGAYSFYDNSKLLNNRLGLLTLIIITIETFFILLFTQDIILLIPMISFFVLLFIKKYNISIKILNGVVSFFLMFLCVVMFSLKFLFNFAENKIMDEMLSPNSDYKLVTIFHD